MRALLEPLAEDMVKKEEDKQRYYEILLHETMRLSRLINDMLELSRLQATEDHAEMSIVKLEDVMETIMLRFQSQANDQKIRLEMPHDLEAVSYTHLMVVLVNNIDSHAALSYH